jgi:hypothetical protein
MTIKCIRLPLPRGAGGMAPGFYLTALRKTLNEWIGTKSIVYTLDTKKDYTAELKFEDQQHYTLFLMSWPADKIWKGYEIIKQ